MKEMLKRITIVFLMLAVIFAFAPLPSALAADSDSGMLRASGLNKGKVLIDLSNGGKSYSINSVVVGAANGTPRKRRKAPRNAAQKSSAASRLACSSSSFSTSFSAPRS